MASEEDILGNDSVEGYADELEDAGASASERDRPGASRREVHLKMLRSMGMILMEHLKGKVKDLEGIPGFAGSASHLDASNLLKSSLENFMTLEDIKACLNTHLKRGPLKRQREEVMPNQKRQDDEM